MVTAAMTTNLELGTGQLLTYWGLACLGGATLGFFLSWKSPVSFAVILLLAASAVGIGLWFLVPSSLTELGEEFSAFETGAERVAVWFVLFYLATAIFYSLLAFWSVASNCRLAIRVFAFLLGLCLLLMIGAFEPFLLFSIQSAVILALGWLYKLSLSYRNAVNETGSFVAPMRKIREKFSASFWWRLVAILAIIVSFRVWWAYVGVSSKVDWLNWGIVCGLNAAIAFWIVNGRLSLQWRLPLGIGLVTGLLFLNALYEESKPRHWTNFELSVMPYGIALIQFVCTTFLLALERVSRFSRWLGCRQDKPVPTSGLISRIGFAACFGLAVCGIAGLSFLFLLLAGLLPNPIGRPQITYPNDNGFENLRNAAQMISFRDLDNLPETVTGKALATAIEKNADVFEEIEMGLSKECVNPYFNGRNFGVPWKKARRFSSLDVYHLGDGLNARIRFRREQKRISEAAEDAMRILRIADVAAKHADFFAWDRGLSFESYCWQQLYRLHREFDVPTCHDLIARLAQHDANREPFSTVMDRQKADWFRSNFWSERFQAFLGELANAELYGSGEELKLLPTQIANNRLTIVALALQIYRLEHKRYPENLNALVPDILDALPQDPFQLTGSGFIYQRTGDSYHLRSVGRDGRDDGDAPNDDICLEWLYR